MLDYGEFMNTINKLTENLGLIGTFVGQLIVTILILFQILIMIIKNEAKERKNLIQKLDPLNNNILLIKSLSQTGFQKLLDKHEQQVQYIDTLLDTVKSQAESILMTNQTKNKEGKWLRDIYYNNMISLMQVIVKNELKDEWRDIVEEFVDIIKNHIVRFDKKEVIQQIEERCAPSVKIKIIQLLELDVK